MNYPPFEGLNYGVFETILMEYGEMLYPGEGFGECTFSAKNTLLHTEREVVDEDDASPEYSKPYSREKLRVLKDALLGRLGEIEPDSQEAIALRFMADYLKGIEVFLTVHYDPEDDPCQNPRKLAFYASYFETLKRPLIQANVPELAGLHSRADLAAQWCRNHLLEIS